ncbi:MAG TPA: hypothetical protein VGL44_04250 [Gaiellales bacterium]
MTTQKATLKPYLEEIRQWVEQGRTDIWIAHTLNSTPASISAFRSQHGILRRDAAEGRGSAIPPPVIPPDAPPEEAATKPRRRRTKKATGGVAPLSGPLPEAEVATPAAAADSSSEEGTGRRRRRRGGRGRKQQSGYEAVLDTGEEGYGFWLDGVVRDDPVFAEHWAGRRALIVRIEADQIVIRPDDRE